jgi:hypothetical protein
MERVMTKAVWSSVLTAAAVLLFTTQAFAQATDTASVTVSATVNAKAKLTVGSGTASFADADPDVTPLLSATAISLDVKARTSTSGNVTLTVQADDDLTNGTDTIGIGNLTWTVTGTNFAAGTMSKTAAVSVGSWTGGGTQSGTQTYKLVNSWSYKTGSYTATITYTLTAP